MSVSILDLIQYVRKHLKLIFICIVVAALLGQIVLSQMQQYVASTTIQYSYAEAQEGKNPKGDKLDVYEIMSPTVIEKVITSLNLNTSVERIRSSISVTPFIDATTQTKQKALTEKGEDFEFNPTEYTVAFTYDGSYGASYGAKVLNKLLESYDEYFRQTYTGQNKIPDLFTNIDYNKYDYMELCDLIESQVNEITGVLASLSEDSPDFRSSKTGLTMNDLKFYFSNLSQNDYTKLYSYVRMGCLSKDSEVLIKNYQYKVEQRRLEMAKKTEEARVAYETMLDFYREYKEGQIASNNNAANDNRNNDNVNTNIIRENDLTKILTTYDKIINQYVDSGTAAIQAEKDIDYYNMLIEAFQNDTVSEQTKEAYTNHADALIEKIVSEMVNYIQLTNETINDYNVYKGTQYISYLSSVGTEATLSHSVITLFSLFAGLAIGILMAVFIEILRKLKERASLESRREKMAMLKEGISPVNLDKLLPMERALYEAAMDNFKEFTLFYLPMVNTDGEWVGAEALVRWNSSEFGMVSPAEFIPIAEKHGIMEMLGGWILREACNQCKLWNTELSPDLLVSINFTINQVSGPLFMDGIFQVISESKVDPANIILEISHGGSIADVETVSKKLMAMKALDVSIAIDNFGSEASSVDALYRLPVDYVKVDREYVQNIQNNLNNQNFITNVINIANMMEYKVCAEGIEKAEEAAMLKELGVQFFQGYHYSRPISANQFESIYRLRRELV